jgi:hypothetical protein
MECAARSVLPLLILIEQLPNDLQRSIHRVTFRLPTIYESAWVGKVVGNLVLVAPDLPR